MQPISTQRRLMLGIVSCALLAATLAGPAAAADTVSLAITGNGLTASVANLTLTSVAYQNAAHTVSGGMVLTADDSTGSALGWNVTIQSSAFVWAGTANGGVDIPAANFAISSAATPTLIAGQIISAPAATGPQVPTVSPVGALDTARKTLQATAGYGSGTYSQALGVTLTIPAQSRVGVYTGTLTTTITSAP